MTAPAEETTAEQVPAGTGVTTPTVALVGVTASGKSAAALDAARTAGRVELLSVDSMAVYRGMDVGTDKPDRAVRAEFAYHLVDVADPATEFSVFDFQAAATEALAGIGARGNAALLVGGTGLYLRAVVDRLVLPGRFPEVASRLSAELDHAGPPGTGSRGRRLAGLHRRLGRLDPLAAARMEATNERRILRALEVTVGSGRPFSSFGPGLGRYPATAVAMVGIRPDPATLDRRIGERLERQMDAGFLDEVRSLASRPGGLSATARQALGYRELLAHLEDGVPLADALATAERRTRAFARRQWAWFRRDPRIVWTDSAEGALDAVLRLLPAGERDEVGDCPGR